MHDHECRVEAVGAEEVGRAAVLFEQADHLGVDGVVGGAREVVVQEVDLLGCLTVGAERGGVTEPGDDGNRVEHALLAHRLPHRTRGRPSPRDEHEVGVAGEHLLCERRELRDVLGHEHRVDRRALATEDRLDRRDVALPERGVLCEDGHRLARNVVEEGAGGRDILRALATRAERVVVDAGDRVGSRGAGDVEHLVLGRLLGDSERNTR